MSSILTVLPIFQLFDDDGNPLSGGKIITQQAGTSTPQLTWQDSGGTVAFSNPIILDASGRPSGPIYLLASPAYKFIITDSCDVAVGATLDDYIAYAPAS